MKVKDKPSRTREARLVVTVGQKTEQRVVAAAREADVPIGEWVRRAIAVYLEQCHGNEEPPDTSTWIPVTSEEEAKKAGIFQRRPDGTIVVPPGEIARIRAGA